MVKKSAKGMQYKGKQSTKTPAQSILWRISESSKYLETPRRAF